MPVHKVGPRLYHSIPFKHLVKHSGSAHGGRSSNISLNLVPFVDMMTMLVCFLLMVFSASGELLQAQRGQNIRPKPGEVCPDGLAILQADEGTDARLINKIVNTAKAAGFDNLMFAVKNK